MHVAIGILSLLSVVADSPIKIKSSDEGRVVTVSLKLEESQVTLPTSGEITARQGEAVLTLRLVDDDGELGEPIFGEYQLIGSRLQFKPRYRLVSEYEYRATYRKADGSTASLDYRVPRLRATEPAVVEQVYPSARVLPENHLKFYIHFSKPMREGRAIFDRIHLESEDGTRVEDPWRRTELWTEDARRLTLWIHPGRVKTGVNLREDLGPVLEPNRRYTLVIDADAQDADGQPLGRSFTKEFETTVADRQRPQPDQWELAAPAIATQQPLEIRFHESLDHALSQRLLAVQDEHGRPVAGRIELGDQEQSWSFLPAVPWREQDYLVVVDPLLEDLAGNTPERVFDTDLTATPALPLVLVLSFTPKSVN